MNDEKPKKRKRLLFLVELSDETKRDLRAVAEQHGRSMRQEARIALDEYVKRERRA